MPFDGARWAIEIGAVDKTATAFAAVDRRMRSLEHANQQMARSSATAFAAVSARFAGMQKMLEGGLDAGRSAESIGGLLPLMMRFGPVAAAAGAAFLSFRAGLKIGELGDAAEQLGLTTDRLQSYRVAALEGGVSTENLDGALMRLARAMGDAKDGNADLINLFDKLDVKILNSKGELIGVSDALPGVARGLLNISSTTERSADMMTLLGRSGARMATVLGDIAQGNDALTASMKARGSLASADTIDVWKRVGDQMAIAQDRGEKLMATLGAPVAMVWLNNLNVGLDLAAKAMDKIRSGAQWLTGNVPASIQGNLQNQIDAMNGDITAFIERGYKNSDPALQELIRKRDALQAELNKHPVTMPTITVMGDAGNGVSNPTPKTGGAAGADPYAKLIAGAQQYIALKEIETKSLGMNAEAAANLRHQQEFQGKASAANLVLGPPQVAQLDALAAAMARADATFARAKFMDDATTKSAEFIAAQEIERDTLWMSAEAADAYRIAQGYLNDAKARGMELSTAEADRLHDLARQQASASARTRDAKEIYDLARNSFVGFVGDLRQGVQAGQSFWDAFANAGLNALNTIGNKLIEMAAQRLFEAAFSGGGGGGGSGGIGGIIGNLLGTAIGGIFGGGGGVGGLIGSGMLSGIGGIYAKGGVFNGGREIAFADGAAFRAGNVIPFASGGVVAQPTRFPMAGGRTGLMGEAGAEAIMPLRRGPDGRLGVSMHGGALQQPQRIDIYLVDDKRAARIGDGMALKSASTGLFGGTGASFIPGGVLDGLFKPHLGSPLGFAKGGVPPIGTPYLVGERGPEVRIDGRPGQIFNRRQWDAMGSGGGDRPIVITVTGDTDLVRVAANDAAVRVVREASPQIEGRAVRQATKLAPKAVAADKAMHSPDWRRRS